MFKRFMLGAVFALLGFTSAFAQSSVLPFYYNASGVKTPVGSSNPLPISGTISASLGGFAPNGSYGTLTATDSTSASTSLPTGTDVGLQNISSVDLSCVLDTTNAVATTNKIIVRAGSTVFVTVGTNTKVACINQTGSASNVVVLLGGVGLGTNFGGGSSGGGGGAVTIADAADVTQGALADASSSVGGAGSLSAKLRRMTTQLDAIQTAVTAAIPAGSAIIGKVGIDQTTPGTTNGVQTLSGSTTVVTGNSAIIGPTADGSAASTAPVLVAGTTDGTATGLVAVPKVSAGGLVSVDGSAVTQPVSGTVTNNPAAATTGGTSSYYVQPAASDNHVVIKNGAGTAYSAHVTNNSATRNYLRLYDLGTGFNGCNSATGLIFGMEVPPSDSGFSVNLGGSVGLNFATGLSICVTSGYGSTDTTNATATAMMVNVLYK